jgi:hypothetical protein
MVPAGRKRRIDWKSWAKGRLKKLSKMPADGKPLSEIISENRGDLSEPPAKLEAWQR